MGKLSPDELNQRQNPQGLLTHAQEFHRAAELLRDAVGIDEAHFPLKGKILNPYYYLIGHSLELSMKAILLKSGVNHDTLRQKYGHNLTKCLAGILSIKNFFKTYNDIESFRDPIALLNKGYNAKEFEYRITGPKHWPDPNEILNIAEIMQSICKEFIIESNT